MRDRLIELVKNAEKAFPKDRPVLEIEEFVTDFLLANGVIVPPCKVGDTVYMPWNFNGAEGVAILTVTHIIFDSLHAYIRTDLISDCDEYLAAYNYGKFSSSDFGKTVFLTKREAEQVLKGGAE